MNHGRKDFSRLPTETLRFSIELANAGKISDLLAMTPHLYRASAEGRAEAAVLTALSLSVDTRLTCFVRGVGLGMFRFEQRRELHSMPPALIEGCG